VGVASRGVRAERDARRWLRLDALYCAVAALIALVLCVPLARWFGVPFPLVAVIGAATGAWAWLLHRLAASPAWRRPLAAVAAANVAGSAAVTVLAALAPGVAPRLLLAAVAIEVAAFAVVQTRTLRDAR
jgi:hypothetical protein